MISALSHDDIEIVMELARSLTGTNVTKEHHSVIVQNVIQRFRELGCSDLESYLEYVDHHEEEMSYLMSALTIHTTSWFRENSALKSLELIAKNVAGRVGALPSSAPGGIKVEPFKVLSIACSTGEEVYSIASVLEGVRRQFIGFSYQIEGWDIDPISLRTARQGVYEQRSIDLSHKSNLERVGVFDQDKFQISSQIKNVCRFKTVNIVKPPMDNEQFDFIFCRNMLIYFESSIIRSIMNFIQGKMRGDAHLCVGVSETSAVTSAALKSNGSAIYKLVSGVKSSQVIPLSKPVLTAPAPDRDSHILVVDDEADLRDVMIANLSEDDYRVTGAASAELALELMKRKSFALILSDFRMNPGMNGLEFCKLARQAGHKGGFVIISGHADRQMAEQALAYGCDEIFLKPLFGEDLTRLARSYMGSPHKHVDFSPELILLGASTGGTEALSRLLVNMPSECPPVVVVQHITTGFASDFAIRLSKISGLKLGEMKQDEVIRSGHLYIPLGDYHIGVREVGKNLKLIVSDAAPMNSHRPSVDFLFSSASSSRRKVFAALLTGMGKDGAKGLLELRHAGAETFAQSEESCVVFGMPKEAIRMNAAMHICAPLEIRANLNERLKRLKAAS